MAYVSLISSTETSITVDISGLSMAQNKYNEFRFRIDGGSWRSVSVQSNYSGNDSPNYTFTGLKAGTLYHIEGEAYTNSWYSTDSKWASTKSSSGGGGTDPDPDPWEPDPDPGPTRPRDWEWYIGKYSGYSFNITASEWNAFFDKINEFRSYKGLSYYSYTRAYWGYNFTASQYNEARNAIAAMNPWTSIPSYRSRGETIYASDINSLRDSLNSVS